MLKFQNINKIYQNVTNAEISSLFRGPNVWYVPVPKLVKIVTFKHPVAKEKTTQCTVKTLKLIFSKMASTTHATFKNT